MGNQMFQSRPAATLRIPARKRPVRHCDGVVAVAKREKCGGPSAPLRSGRDDASLGVVATSDAASLETLRSQRAVTAPSRVVAMAGRVLKTPSGSRV